MSARAAAVGAGAVLAVTIASGAAYRASSKWAYLDGGQRLRYASDARGNRIMDFSHAGYQGGGVTLPAVRAARTLGPEPGDNTARIQAALDAVAQLPLDEAGFRGAVVLGPGRYEVASTLKIAATGVVLRGSGAGASGTTLVVTGAPHRVLEIGGAGTWQREGRTATIADGYVPSGADAVTLDDAAGLRPGDSVLIDRPVTEAWIGFMGMDRLSRDGKPQTWIAPGTMITSDRRIAAISANRVTLDVPLSDAIDADYAAPRDRRGPGGAATLVKYGFPGRIERVGLESLRVQVPPRDVPITEGQYTLLRMSGVSDAWVRGVVSEDTQNTITLGSTARRVTLEDVHVRHSVPFTGAASPADIAISGTQILVHRSSVTGQGVWPIVTQAGVTGPNAVVDFRADHAGVAPHQRWATGLLVDTSVFRNGTERRPNIAFSNREHAGSGHGWSVGWAVAWNVTADYVLIQQPPGAMNWCIGCTGRPPTILWHGNPIPVPEIPSDTFESPGVAVTPRSLYIQQLRDRLGEPAVRNIQ
jgi:hypothetical protein